MMCSDDDVGVRSGHRPTKRQRTSMEYMHGGYKVCQNTFTFLHGVSKRKIENIRDHCNDDGITSREHGNIGKLPKACSQI